MAEATQLKPRSDILDDDLNRVRQLLLGAEYDQLLGLKEALNDPKQFSEKLSEVIAEAISIRADQDNAMGEALGSTIDLAMKSSIQKDPQSLADALYPVMGPAIRRSITETLNQMLENINQVMEQGLSPKSLGWRFEAWRAGKPYSEYVLSKSFDTQVEQIFLIHNETSLLLAHLVDEKASSRDPDMVSSMLAAIQDFIRDSFEVSEGDGLNSLRLGDLTVVIERGPEAVLAAVVRGSVTSDLRLLFVEALEAIHHRYAPALAEFDGDSTAFSEVDSHLQAALSYESLDDVEVEKKPPWLAWLFVAGLLIIGGYFKFISYQKDSAIEQMMTALRAEPGVVVTELVTGLPGATFAGNDKVRILGLRDPDASDLSGVIKQLSMVGVDVELALTAYWSTELEIVKKRADAALGNLDGLTYEIQDTTLYLRGNVELGQFRWLERNWRNIYGIRHWDISALDVFDAELQALSKQIDSIEAFNYYFDKSIVEVNAEGASLQSLITNVKFVLDLAAVKNLNAGLVVIGKTDGTGSLTTNEKVSADRANSFKQVLIDHGIQSQLITVDNSLNCAQAGAAIQERKVCLVISGVDRNRLLQSQAALRLR